MPSPAQDDAVDENKPVDPSEEESQPAVQSEPVASPPVKRGRGRPKGSKNKTKSAVAGPTKAPSATPKRRGRPPKDKSAASASTSAPKGRGRPKKPKEGSSAAPDVKDDEDEDNDSPADEPPPKRGRISKETES